jgi:hypothetical protein
VQAFSEESGSSVSESIVIEYVLASEGFWQHITMELRCGPKNQLTLSTGGDCWINIANHLCDTGTNSQWHRLRLYWPSSIAKIIVEAKILYDSKLYCTLFKGYTRKARAAVS